MCVFTQQTMSIPKEKVPNSSMDSNNETIITAQQLKIQFRSTRKGDLEPIESYVKKLKSTADSLTAIGNPISDPDLVLQLVAGLPNPQYLLIRNTISSQLPLPNFSEACSMLYEYEKTITPGAAAAESSNSSNNSSSNSTKSTVEMIHDIASTVSTVASIAREFWNALGPWSGGSSSGSKSMPKPKPSTPGNKKNGRTGGRGNNNRGRGGGPSTRNSGRKQ